MQTGTVQTSDGCDISYTLYPAPPDSAGRIALIHSLALDRSIWDGVAARLAGSAEVLTYDCRGHGRSGRKASAFTSELFARDLAELLDHVGWQSTAAAGCSKGGCVAQAFAGLYSSRASALGLIDTTAWYGLDGPEEWRERAATARLKGFQSMASFQAQRWFSDAFRSEHPELVSATTEVFLANDLDCYASACTLLGEADLRRYLPSFRLPVTIIVGEEDMATPVSESRLLHQAISESKLVILPGARHLTPIECPDAIATELLALLRRV
jgi:3-oxoadipate enol-lactonase